MYTHTLTHKHHSIDTYASHVQRDLIPTIVKDFAAQHGLDAGRTTMLAQYLETHAPTQSPPPAAASPPVVAKGGKAKRGAQAKREAQAKTAQATKRAQGRGAQGAGARRANGGNNSTEGSRFVPNPSSTPFVPGTPDRLAKEFVPGSGGVGIGGDVGEGGGSKGGAGGDKGAGSSTEAAAASAAAAATTKVKVPLSVLAKASEPFTPTGAGVEGGVVFGGASGANRVGESGGAGGAGGAGGSVEEEAAGGGGQLVFERDDGSDSSVISGSD